MSAATSRLRHASRSEIARTRTRIRREARARARRMPLERPGVGAGFWRGVGSVAVIYAIATATYFAVRSVLE